MVCTQREFVDNNLRYNAISSIVTPSLHCYNARAFSVRCTNSVMLEGNQITR